MTHFTLILIIMLDLTEEWCVYGTVVTAYTSHYAKNKIHFEMSPICYQALISIMPMARQGLASWYRISNSCLNWNLCCSTDNVQVRSHPARMDERNFGVCLLKRIAVLVVRKCTCLLARMMSWFENEMKSCGFWNLSKLCLTVLKLNKSLASPSHKFLWIVQIVWNISL